MLKFTGRRVWEGMLVMLTATYLPSRHLPFYLDKNLNMISIRRLQCISAKVFLCPRCGEVFTRSSGNIVVDDISIIKFPILLRKNGFTEKMLK